MWYHNNSHHIIPPCHMLYCISYRRACHSISCHITPYYPFLKPMSIIQCIMWMICKLPAPAKFMHCVKYSLCIIPELFHWYSASSCQHLMTAPLIKSFPGELLLPNCYLHQDSFLSQCHLGIFCQHSLYGFRAWWFLFQKRILLHKMFGLWLKDEWTPFRYSLVIQLVLRDRGKINM